MKTPLQRGWDISSLAPIVGIPARLSLVAALLLSMFGCDALRPTEVRRVTIATVGNSVAFDRKSLTVPANVRVQLVFENRAALDSQIQHDVVVLKPGTKEEFIKRLANAGYKLAELGDDPAIIGASHTIEPGDSGQVTFNVGEAGEYPYICTMPGHAEIMQMQGILRVGGAS